MRRLFLNPFTVLAVAVGVFYALKDALGFPATGWGAMLFLFLHAYGCIGAYLLVFGTSSWVPVLKRMKFPEAYGNRVFMAGMGLSSVPLKALYVSAIAIFVFGAAPAAVTSFFAALMTVAAFAASVPIMRPPQAAAQ